MVSKEGIIAALNARMSRILLFAEAALPQQQFQAFRKLVLNELGKSGLGKDLDKLYGEDQPSDRHGMGRNISARKEVPR